jgi:hypothetical protein
MRSKALLGAFLGLSGCATTGIPGQQPVPEEFLAQCRAQEVEILTNGDLARSHRALREALERCNLDKQAIREWSERVVNGAE